MNITRHDSYKPLSNGELTNLFIQYKNGDKEAKAKIIESNIRFMMYNVVKKYKNSKYDLNELFQIAAIGLIKAVDTFDITKNFKFLTYAVRCMDNEIFMYMRKNKKYQNDLSLDREFEDINDELTNHLMLKKDEKVNIEQDYLEKEEKKEIYEIIENLPEEEKTLIKLYFGINCKNVSQQDLAKIYNVKQSAISRRITRILNKVKEQLDIPVKTIVKKR